MNRFMYEEKRGCDFIPGNHVDLIASGEPFFDQLVKMINETKKTIHVYAYIISDDTTGVMVIDNLIEACKRGVKVYVMADGYASRKINKQLLFRMKQHGIDFRFFNPLLSIPYIYLGRRMHHKVIVSDNSQAMVGGLNIADRYNDMPDQKAWLDFAILIKGPVVNELSAYCKLIWDGQNDKHQLSIQNIKSMKNEGDSYVRIRRNDWLFSKKEITATYEEMFTTAKKEIIILCSYFIPGVKIRQMISGATSRGVRVIVIAAGISDVPITKYAERWLYDWMFRNNVLIYEYQNNVLHGKLALCDETWLTIGSYNLNNISAYASVELNVDVKNEKKAHEIKKWILGIMQKECMIVTVEKHRNGKNIFSQLLMWCSYQFIRVTLNCFTLFFPKKF
jgi:cardiolipin synthase